MSDEMKILTYQPPSTSTMTTSELKATAYSLLTIERERGVDISDIIHNIIEAGALTMGEASEVVAYINRS